MVLIPDRQISSEYTIIIMYTRKIKRTWKKKRAHYTQSFSITLTEKKITRERERENRLFSEKGIMPMNNHTTTVRFPCCRELTRE